MTTKYQGLTEKDEDLLAEQEAEDNAKYEADKKVERERIRKIQEAAFNAGREEILAPSTVDSKTMVNTWKYLTFKDYSEADGMIERVMKVFWDRYDEVKGTRA